MVKSASNAIFENERKFLVIGDEWKHHVTSDTQILQGYLPASSVSAKILNTEEGAFLDISLKKKSWLVEAAKNRGMQIASQRIWITKEVAQQLLDTFGSHEEQQGRAADKLDLTKDDTFRIRFDKEGVKLAFKTPRIYKHGTIVRKEIECEVKDKIQAKYILEHYCDRIIEKHRFAVPHKDGQHKWEIDVFTDPELRGLVIAEIEMDDPSKQLSTPKWIGDDVTLDKRYSSRTLAALASTNLEINSEDPFTLPQKPKKNSWKAEVLTAIDKQHIKKSPRHKDPVFRS
jgi:CYTH domain-containing protein